MRKVLNPKHGTWVRRQRGCRCVACVSRTGPQGDDYKVRWHYGTLVNFMGLERLREWYDADQLNSWKESGLSDSEADMVAITLGRMPWEVWNGWIEAGLDIKVDENV